jgi:hypothetical protein
MPDDLDREREEYFEKRRLDRDNKAYWEGRRLNMVGALFCSFAALGIVCEVLGATFLGGLLLLGAGVVAFREIVATGSHFDR